MTAHRELASRKRRERLVNKPVEYQPDGALVRQYVKRGFGLASSRPFWFARRYSTIGPTS